MLAIPGQIGNTSKMLHIHLYKQWPYIIGVITTLVLNESKKNYLVSKDSDHKTLEESLFL